MNRIDTYDVVRAYGNCRRRKRHTAEEQSFSLRVTDNLLSLNRELVRGTYHPLPNRSFLVDWPVLREIFAPKFKDRICHHLAADKFEPLLERELILDCYSCRKGKGTLFGIRRLHRFIAQCSANYTRDCYILTGDISGYFMSIERLRLWQRLYVFISDRYQGDDKESFLWQLQIFIFTSPLENVEIKGDRSRWSELPDRKSLFCACGAPKPSDYNGTYRSGMDWAMMGLPIGALLSQMLGNFYLSPFDHYCKSVERLRFYGRYVDDFFVVHTDKAYLLQLVVRLQSYLAAMGLQLHPNKIRIVHYSLGVPYLGAFIRGQVILPGKRLQMRFIRLLCHIDTLTAGNADTQTISRLNSRLNSYLGLMRHYNARLFIGRQLSRHPGVYCLFRIDSRPYKAVPLYRLREMQRQRGCLLADRIYHRQFRRSRKGRFRSRLEIYDGLMNSQSPKAMI